MKWPTLFIVLAAVIGGVVGAATTPSRGGAPLLVTLQATAPCTYRDGGALPDAKCTPGAINHAVTQKTIGKTICVPGWTSTVRPPVTVTEPEKRVALRQYGYAFGTSLAGYEYDHLIPLELGGATNDLRNLFPEPHHVKVGGVDLGSFSKDVFENLLHREVCSKPGSPGHVTLAQARRYMRTDWTRTPKP